MDTMNFNEMDGMDDGAINALSGEVIPAGETPNPASGAPAAPTDDTMATGSPSSGVRSSYLYDYGRLEPLVSSIHDALIQVSGSSPAISALRESAHIANLEFPPSAVSLQDQAQRLAAMVSHYQIATRDSAIDPIVSDIVGRMVAAEEKRLTLLSPENKASLAPGGILSSLFSRAPSESSARIDVSLRSEREKQMQNAFSRLDGLMTTMKAHVGDPAWEAGDGRQMLKETGELMRETRRHVARGWWKTISNESVSKLDSLSRDMDSIARQSSDPEFKKLAERVAEMVAKFIEKLLSAIGMNSSPSASRSNAPAP